MAGVVGGAAVGYHALDADSVAAEPAQGVEKKGGGGCLALVGEPLDIGRAGGFVDGDMDKVLASAGVAVYAPWAGDRVVQAVQAAELVNGEREALTGASAVVAAGVRVQTKAREPAQAIAGEPARRWTEEARGTWRSARPSGASVVVATGSAAARARQGAGAPGQGRLGNGQAPCAHPLSVTPPTCVWCAPRRRRPRPRRPQCGRLTARYCKP